MFLLKIQTLFPTVPITVKLLKVNVSLWLPKEYRNLNNLLRKSNLFSQNAG